MAPVLSEAERARLRLRSSEAPILAVRARRGLWIGLAVVAVAAGVALVAGGRLVLGGALLGVVALLAAPRVFTPPSYVITNARIVVRRGPHERSYDLSRIARIERRHGFSRDRLVVHFQDGSAPLVIPDVLNGHIVAAHVMELSRAQGAAVPA